MAYLCRRRVPSYAALRVSQMRYKPATKTHAATSLSLYRGRSPKGRVSLPFFPSSYRARRVSTIRCRRADDRRGGEAERMRPERRRSHPCQLKKETAVTSAHVKGVHFAFKPAIYDQTTTGESKCCEVERPPLVCALAIRSSGSSRERDRWIDGWIGEKKREQEKERKGSPLNI